MYGQRDSTLNPKYILVRDAQSPYGEGARKIPLSSKGITISAARIKSEIF